MNPLGKYLTSELKNKHWDQVDLAHAVDISEATISRIISGQRKPSFKLCNAISKALDLPPELVLEKAGLIPKKKKQTDMVTTITHKVSMLSEKDQKVILKIIETIIDEHK